MKTSHIHYEQTVEGIKIDWNTSEYAPGELHDDDDKQVDMTEELSDSFQNGWQQAVGAAQIAFVNGKIVEFFQNAGQADDYSMTDVSMSDIDYVAKIDQAAWAEAAREFGDKQPHHNEPAGTGEALDPGVVVTIDTDAGEVAVKAAADSGEPSLESQEHERGTNVRVHVDSGTWTMSQDELQSRLDAEYERGRNARRHADERHTTPDVLGKLANEVFEAVWGVGGAWRDRTRTEVIATFAVSFARRLGWKVND